MQRTLLVLVVGAVLAAACSPADDEGEGHDRMTGGVPLPSAEQLPETDLRTAGVPLRDIHLDTFDGGSIPLSEATPEDIRRLRDRIPPIEQPVYVRPDGIDVLDDDDLVLGYVTDAGQAYAYPTKILNFHEIVNETLDDVPVLVTYCPLCRSGIVYERRLDGRELTFGNTAALFDNDMVMYDHQTNSYWWHVAGRAIVGELTGRELEPLPSRMVTWGEWQQRHPDTYVLSTDTGFSRPYGTDPFRGFKDRVNAGRRPFPDAEISRSDPRLADAEEVVGVVLQGQARAYPVGRLGDAVVNDELAGVPLVVFSQAEGPSGAVFDRRLDGNELTFRFEGGVIVDERTGSRWGMDGRARAGPLEGAQLTAVPTRNAFWFAFVASFPETDVFVADD